MNTVVFITSVGLIPRELLHGLERLESRLGQAKAQVGQGRIALGAEAIHHDVVHQADLSGGHHPLPRLNPR